jgi:L-iditol 2-dehydrogenase
LRAAVLLGPKKIDVMDVPEPRIRSGEEVKIRVKSVGICGSDAHFYMDGRLASWVVEEPLILGHECAGEVVEIGEEVESLKVGDLVAVEPGIPCRKCEWCKRGEYNLCPHIIFLAVPGVNGAFAEYLVSVEDFVFKLPDHLSAEEGAMMEPLSVAVEAAKLCDIRLGESVAILGAGPIGILCTQVALAAGATEIYVTDLYAPRLDFVQKLSKNRIIPLNASEVDVFSEIMKLTGNTGVDKTLETAGSFETFRLAPLITKRGGRVTLVGIPPFKEHLYRASDLFDRTVTIKAVYRYANDYPIAIQLASKGLVDVRSLITHRFNLNEVQKGLEITATHADNVIKAVVNIF